MTTTDIQLTTSGVLELSPRGFGFLRNAKKHYQPQAADAYVGQPLIRKFNLREGLHIVGTIETGRNAQPAPREQRETRGYRDNRDSRDNRDNRDAGPTGPRLATIESIEGVPAASWRTRIWEELTPIDPHEHIRLETDTQPLTTRVMDLFTPIGKGQRGLIVAPPRTGKTVLIQHIAAAVARNHPELYLMVLLVDERPEEVTDMRRTIQGEVIASSADNDAVNHVRIAELVMERAKRLAESGQQVFVLLDSLTRLARAYNKTSRDSGRTLSGGVDSRALEVPKRLFGQARVFEEGGSLTILGTCLVETGSRMDDVIFEEFKGTGNMELVLDRKLAERRIYPAIDLAASGTRKEERILDAETLHRVNLMRRHLMEMHPVQAMESLLAQMGKAASNQVLLDRMRVK